MTTMILSRMLICHVFVFFLRSAVTLILFFYILPTSMHVSSSQLFCCRFFHENRKSQSREQFSAETIDTYLSFSYEKSGLVDFIIVMNLYYALISLFVSEKAKDWCFCMFVGIKMTWSSLPLLSFWPVSRMCGKISSTSLAYHRRSKINFEIVNSEACFFSH